MRPVFTFLCTASLLLFHHQNSMAQFGQLDLSFDVDGIVIQPMPAGSSYSQGSDLLIQPDGKLLMSGVAGGSSFTDFGLVRFLSDGSPDNTFGTGGIVITDFFAEHDCAYSMAFHANGKILLGGYANQPGGPAQFALARYTSTGILDTSFGTGGKVVTIFPGSEYNIIHSITVQADGKIVAVGTTGSGGMGAFALARYHANGDLDLSFDGDGLRSVPMPSPTAYLNALFIQPDGKIVASGSWGNTVLQSRIFRFHTDGSMDSTLIAGIPGQNMINDIIRQPDGKIIAVGKMEITPQVYSFVARFDSNGDLDPGFGTGSDGVTQLNVCPYLETLNSVALQADGKILAAGYAYNYPAEADFLVLRLEADGTADPTFGTAGITTTNFTNTDFASSCAIQSDGRVLVSGTVDGGSGTAFGLARYHTSITGLTQQDVKAGFNVYPNPVSGRLHVSSSSHLHDGILRLINNSGQVLIQQTGLSGNHWNVDLSVLPAGIFVLEIRDANHVSRTKLVKE